MRMAPQDTTIETNSADAGDDAGASDAAEPTVHDAVPSDASAESVGDVDRVTAARRRLELALGRLEGAVRLRLASEKSQESLEKQIHHLSQDRVRMAEEIDGLNRSVRRLSVANHEASKRIDAAVGSIRSIVDPGKES